MKQYKAVNSLQDRQQECDRIKSKYPDRIPILVFKDIRSNAFDIQDIDKHKFLVPGDLSFGQFSYVIRKRIKLKPEISLFVFTASGFLPTTSTMISEIYNTHKDKDDGFLYIVYSGENTFG